MLLCFTKAKFDTEALEFGFQGMRVVAYLCQFSDFMEMQLPCVKLKTIFDTTIWYRYVL